MIEAKYFKGPSESLVGSGEIYTEFNGEIAVRQVEIYNGKYYSSRSEYHEGIGLGLYDGLLSELDMSDSVEISAEEFDLIWEKSK